MALKVRSGRASISISGGLEEMVRDAVEQANPEVVKGLRKHARRVYDPAKRAWPVKSGVSKDRLQREERLVGTTRLESVIFNDATVTTGDGREFPYPYAVRFAGTDRRAWEALVDTPGRKSIALLEDELAEALGKVLDGS
jgi:hypothetical protein